MKKNEIHLKAGFTTMSPKGWYEMGPKGFVCSLHFDYRWVNMYDVELKSPSVNCGKILGDE